MLTTRNSLPVATREAMVNLCNARLADAVDLTTHAKQAHWTVRGANFIALHELFDSVHTEAENWMDSIAERVAQLGGQAHGTAAAATEKSKLPRYPLNITDGPSQVDALSASLAAFGKLVRAAIDEAAEKGDAVTADIFTQIGGGVDKQLWFVEAHAYARND
jgi:starvation-inducible DNA-binding protein